MLLRWQRERARAKGAEVSHCLNDDTRQMFLGGATGCWFYTFIRMANITSTNDQYQNVDALKHEIAVKHEHVYVQMIIAAVLLVDYCYCYQS